MLRVSINKTVGFATFYFGLSNVTQQRFQNICDICCSD